MKTIIHNSLVKYGIAALFGTLGGLITLVIVVCIDEGIHILWTELFGMDTTAPTRSAGVFITMAFSTIIISYIVYRYGRAKTSLEGIIQEVVYKGSVNWRKMPKALLISFPSLLSGASLGPEAPAAIASVGATSAIAENKHLSHDNSQHANAAALSGMLGSILSSPFLATSMIAETAKNKLEDIKPLLTTSLIASAFGTATFFVLFGTIFTFNLPTEGYTGSGYIELLVAFIFGLAGCAFAAFMAKFLARINSVFDRIAKSEVQLLLLTGLVVSLLMFAVPLTMFSGQHTLDDLYSYSITAGFLSLLLIAVVKMASTALLLRAGFIGGAVFPALFTGSAFGLALNQIFNVSPMVAASATTVGLLALMLRQPLSAAILTLLIFGFSSGAVVVCGLAGALLVLSILPKKQ